MRKASVKFDKPIAIGFNVLEYSKYYMYSFYYNYLVPKYGNRVKLLYMDTDSYILEIRTDDFYKDIIDDIDKHFDTSNFPASNEYGIPIKNNKIIGKWKIETGNKSIR